MAVGAELVVDHFDEIVKPDGGSVRLLGREGERLRVGYKPGTNEECASCTISAEQLAEMMREALRDHDPGIVEVRVEEIAD